jgi:hypothetical protein
MAKKAMKPYITLDLVNISSDDTIGNFILAGRLLRNRESISHLKSNIEKADFELPYVHALDLFNERKHKDVYEACEARDDFESILKVFSIFAKNEDQKFLHNVLKAAATHWDRHAETDVDEMKSKVARKKIPLNYRWIGHMVATGPKKWWLNVMLFAFTTENMKVPKFLRDHAVR